MTDQNRTPPGATVTRKATTAEALAPQRGYDLSVIASGPGRRGVKTETILRLLACARIEDGIGPLVVVFHHHPKTRLVLRSEGRVTGPITARARLTLAGGPWVDPDRVISLHI